MQLDITFNREQLSLPIATSACIQGLLYQALKADNRFSTQLHDEGNVFDGRHFKYFTFSELSGRYQIEKNRIVFLSEAGLTIRSANDYFIQLLFSYFNSHSTVLLSNNEVTVSNVSLSDKHVFDNEITIRTLSPITVYITEQNGHTVYYSPQDEAFYNAVINNAKRKWTSFFGDDSEFSLEIVPCQNAVFKKRATRFKNTFITAWHGNFILKAPPKVLDFLYHTGIGSKNSQGFGMFEIIAEGGKQVEQHT